jgi:hypothetical protein
MSPSVGAVNTLLPQLLPPLFSAGDEDDGDGALFDVGVPFVEGVWARSSLGLGGGSLGLGDGSFGAGGGAAAGCGGCEGEGGGGGGGGGSGGGGGFADGAGAGGAAGLSEEPGFWEEAGSPGGFAGFSCGNAYTEAVASIRSALSTIWGFIADRLLW